MYAVSRMWRKDSQGKKIRIKVLDKSQVDELLKKYNVELENKNLYDYVYAYHMVMADMMGVNVDDEKPLEKYRPYVKWLDAAQKGTFFHNVAEKYVKAALILDRSYDVPLELNEKCLEDIIDEEKEATMKVIPYVALGDVEDEVEDISAPVAAKSTFLYWPLFIPFNI